MRDYARIAPTFWTRGSGRQLRGTPEAQLLALYIFSAPSSHAAGIFYLPLATMVHETGLALETVQALLVMLEGEKMVYFDEAEDLVYVPEMASYQIATELGASDKRVPWLKKELRAFASHSFAKLFWDRYEGPYALGAWPWEALRRPFKAPPKGVTEPQEAPSKGVDDPGWGAPKGHGKALRSQDQDLDLEQEQEQEAPLGSTKASEAIIGALRQTRVFRAVATEAFAMRLAHRCNEHGHMGTIPLAQILKSIDEAGVKAADQEAATGITLDQERLARMISGFVQQGGIRRRTMGSNDPASAAANDAPTDPRIELDPETGGRIWDYAKHGGLPKSVGAGVTIRNAPMPRRFGDAGS